MGGRANTGNAEKPSIRNKNIPCQSYWTSQISVPTDWGWNLFPRAGICDAHNLQVSHKSQCIPPVWHHSRQALLHWWHPTGFKKQAGVKLILRDRTADTSIAGFQCGRSGFFQDQLKNSNSSAPFACSPAQFSSWSSCSSNPPAKVLNRILRWCKCCKETLYVGCPYIREEGRKGKGTLGGLTCFYLLA